MDDVKSMRLVEHHVAFDDMWRNAIRTLRMQTQTAIDNWHEARGCQRVAAGKQRDLVPKRDELLSKVRDDPFGAAVTRGWHAFEEWCDLGNLHQCTVALGGQSVRLTARVPQEIAESGN